MNGAGPSLKGLRLDSVRPCRTSHPPSHARISAIRQMVNRGGGGPGRRNDTQFTSTCVAPKDTAGVEHMLVVGFPPHHRFPPKRNPKPRCAPRRRGFSYEVAPNAR
jgi:hypothetical protein